MIIQQKNQPHRNMLTPYTNAHNQF